MGIVHVLARNGTFLFRFNDGEFGSKWSGIWKDRTKYFDYFAFKVNDEWLTKNNISDFKYINSMLAISTYKTRYGNVDEKVYALSNGILVQLIPKFDAEVMMEYGVNIRDRTENYVESKRYNTTVHEGMIISTYQNRTAVVKFPKGGTFERKEEYDVHIPGRYAREKGFSHYFDDQSVQNKYVPGVVKAKANKGETLEFIFTFNPSYQIELDEYNDYVNELANYGNIKNLVDALNMFANYNEGKIYAGFPYFNEFWVRDALVAIPAYLAIKKYDFVKKVLSKISEMENKGMLPNVEGSTLYPADVPALYLIMMDMYFEETKDREFIKRYFSRINSIAETWRDLASKNGWVIPDSGRQTWMDSIDREKSIEVQALWEIAFKKASELYWQVGERNSLMLKASIAMEETLLKYEEPGYFRDQMNKKINSINQVILLYSDIPKDKKEKIVRNILSNFMTKYGLTSYALNEKAFDFNGYHTGAIWPVMTLLAGIAMVKYNIYVEEGFKLIEITRNLLGLQGENAINEILRPDGKPEGSPYQLWSIAPLLFKLD